MGLCKCPKRKVTNQFCFEHRVNVCEHCMVQNHTKCVVQSYLAWLQDSDYNPNCEFCKDPLGEEDCVRLVCYHLYHWVCLDKHCRSQPASTAPAGYTCPICSHAIFPPDNLVSPVADKLRKVLQDVNWARAGLGLPLLEDAAERKPGVVPSGPRPTPEGESLVDPITMAHELAAKKSARSQAAAAAAAAAANVSSWKEKDSTVVQFDTPTSRRGVSELVDSALASSPLITGVDHDTDKYKRRAPTDWIFRWWRSLNKPMSQRRRGLQSYVMVGVLVLLAVLSLIAVFHYFGRGGMDDPMLDPMNNPNIRVGGDP